MTWRRSVFLGLPQICKKRPKPLSVVTAHDAGHSPGSLAAGFRHPAIMVRASNMRRDTYGSESPPQPGQS